MWDIKAHAPRAVVKKTISYAPSGVVTHNRVRSPKKRDIFSEESTKKRELFFGGAIRLFFWYQKNREARSARKKSGPEKGYAFEREKPFAIFFFLYFLGFGIENKEKKNFPIETALCCCFPQVIHFIHRVIHRLAPASLRFIHRLSTGYPQAKSGKKPLSRAF